jgi:5-methyltetrahydrofolate--homocysteine methyltransferase
MLLNKHFNNEVCDALFGIYPAYSDDNDNIFINGEKFPVLRQQKPDANGICLSLADFVAKNAPDHVGLFAVTIGKNISNMIEQEEDAYLRLLMQTVADRLAEAAAEYLHEKVRKQYWGYAPDENISLEEILKEHYQGIRPAIGYPSLPDQTLIFKLDKILNLNKINISITENGAMTPTSSVAGLYFAHPQSKYFMLGKITDEQLQDYASRSDKNLSEVAKYLARN